MSPCRCQNLENPADGSQGHRSYHVIGLLVMDSPHFIRVPFGKCPGGQSLPPLRLFATHSAQPATPVPDDESVETEFRNPRHPAPESEPP